jgi:4-hydroxybenzoate polyprenyltransferase
VQQTIGLLLEIIKVARPGFWPTHYWFFLLPFAGRDMFGSIAFWVGSVYVCFPLGLLLYGWNDLSDRRCDENNPRKDSWLFGARPSDDTCRRLPWIIAAVQIPFWIAFVWIGGPKMILWMIAVLAVNFTYNTLAFKSRAFLDLLNQVGYLLVFVLASWLCDVPQLSVASMIFCTLFAMQSHLFGQLMDFDQDSDAGRRSTAITVGVTNSKWLIVALLAAAGMIALEHFQFSGIAIFMFAGALVFVVDALFGPRSYPTEFIKGFFILWNILVIATMHFVWRYEVFLVR